MSKFTLKPVQANTHSVYRDGKLVGEFKFIRDRVITTPYGPGGSQRVCNIVTAGTLEDFETDTRHDLGCFSWFKDVRRHVEAHFDPASSFRLNIMAHGVVAEQRVVG